GDADVGADSSAGEPSDELSGHYFRARLAQYRIRRAEERHTTDHAAHAELGTAYAEMDLVQEAVREFAVALKGPRPVAARAVRALRSLTRQEDTLPELVLHVIDNLSQAGFSDAADELAQTVADQWGTNHPLASRLDELRLHIARSTEQLPELESLFPTIATDPAVETEPPGPVRPDSDRGNEHLRELGELLAEIDAEHPSDEVDDALRTDDGHLQALRRVDEYCAAGQMEEAEAALYALLDELQEAHRAREAMIVLDRLLVLRPDDVVLYHQKTELALMVNDRRSLLAAYAELGACLRRQGADRSARTAFGRILDFDPTNEAARAAIAEIDRDEIQLESRAATRKPKARRPRSRTSDADRAAFDLMLDDLGMDDGAEPEGQALGTGDSTGSPDGDPKSEAMSRLELGLAFRQMGMWDEAVDELRAAAPRLDDPSTLLEALGESLHQAGRNDEAVAELEPQLEDLEDDGPMVGALYFLAQAFRAEGRDADARKALARVEAASPGYRDTPQLLSELSQ
ncbi:MAG: hypothetical protein OEM23_02345, partial [Gemmatimonadota bacterium]|nr:hypothetical protein [Gemmatimonadota bacterium]